MRRETEMTFLVIKTTLDCFFGKFIKKIGPIFKAWLAIGVEVASKNFLKIPSI